MAITYRSVKGSPLTSNEVDENFNFLATNKQDNLTFDLTPTNGSSNPVTSNGVYDAIASIDLSAYFKKDGSVTATGDFDLGGNNITNINNILDTGSVLSLSPASRMLIGNDAASVAIWTNRGSGFGVTTNGSFAYLKTTNLTTHRNIQFQDKHYTGVADITDIPSLTGYTPTSTTLNINGVSQDLSTNREWRTGLADTGVLTYTGASAASATQINIGAVEGWIIDNETNPLIPTKTHIVYAGASNVTVTTIGSGLASYVLLDSTGTIVFQNTFPTSAQRKTMIYLSKIGHPAGTITTVGNEPDFIESPLAQLRDLAKYIGFVNPDVRPSANGANLNFNTSAGTVYRASAYFTTDKTIPNEPPVAAQTPASFLYRTQTGAGGGFVSLIDPTTYDNAGTSTAIAGSSNQATNQRIFLVPGLGLIVQKGQTIYATLTDAIAAVQNESFVIYPSLVNNAVLIGILSVTKGCTALNNTTTARFFNADKFGQVGGSTSGVSTATQQSAYNNSLVPQITVTDTLGADTFRSGRASNSSSVIEIQNIAGSTTASINGNGLITGSALVANGTAGAGYLQLVSQSAPPTAVNGSMILYTDSSTRFSMIRRNNANSADITRTLIFNDATVTYTFPSQNTDTLAGLGTAQSFTAQQTFTGSATQLASISLLDTTYKTALDVSATNTLRLGNGFTNITIVPSGGTTFTFSNASLTTSTNLNFTIQGAGGSSIALSNLSSSLTLAFQQGAFVQSYAFGGFTNGTGWTSTTTVTSIFAVKTTLNVASGSSEYNYIDVNPTSLTWTGNLLTGVRSRIASGTNRWNIYADGTASNYLAGNTGIGITATTTSFLSLGASTTSKSSLNIPSGTAPSSPVNGDIWSDGTDIKVRLGGTTYTLTKV